MTRVRVAQKVMAPLCSAAMLLNYPLLSLWTPDSTVLGLPLLPVALFAMWALLIAAMAWLLERSGD